MRWSTWRRRASTSRSSSVRSPSVAQAASSRRQLSESAWKPSWPDAETTLCVARAILLAVLRRVQFRREGCEEIRQSAEEPRRQGRAEGLLDLAERVIVDRVGLRFRLARGRRPAVTRGARQVVRGAEPALHLGEELVALEGLAEVVVHADREEGRDLLAIDVRRQRDDRHRGARAGAVADAAGRLDAVEARHLDVHQDRGRRALLHRLRPPPRRRRRCRPRSGPPRGPRWRSPG